MPTVKADDLVMAMQWVSETFMDNEGKGKYLMPGTALAGERSAAEIRRVAAGLE